MIFVFRIDNACTIPLLYVMEAFVNDADIILLKTMDSMKLYLDKVCLYLEGKGYTEMWGYRPWEEEEKIIKYKKKLRVRQVE